MTFEIGLSWEDFCASNDLKARDIIRFKFTIENPHLRRNVFIIY